MVLGEAGCTAEQISFRYAADLRYAGQHYDLMVDLDGRPSGDDAAAMLRRRFEEDYAKRYRITQEDVEVEVVNVEVVVTGPDGVPVQGLTRDDFELLDDGKPVEITNFYSVADAPMEALDPLDGIERTQRVEPADQRLHLGIFVDGLTLEMQNRQRVLDAVNPYEARIRDFDGDNPATVSSMIQQLGPRFEGPVALNPDKNVIENVGLIELYDTILKRGRDLTIDLSRPVSTPAVSNALQLASTRISDFYTLLGNEAYTDALDAGADEREALESVVDLLIRETLHGV